jgi:hypothetical protein
MSRAISVTTNIEAPASVVWDVLTDLPAYPEWNPFILSISGDLRQGGRLSTRIQPPGGRAMSFRPTVTVLEPGHRLEWLGRLGAPGIFDGRHGFTLTQTDAGGTEFRQEETFSGLLVPLTGSILERTREGFSAMNDALSARCTELRERP